jgi:hypothetical protein
VDALTEQDLELLEAYLDDALEPEEADQLRRRLVEESQLASTLQELRDERAMRVAAWSAMEPSGDSAHRFATRVSIAARSQDRWARVARLTKFASAAAACLLVGVFFGWFTREQDSIFKPTGTPGVVVHPNITDVVSLPSDPGFGVHFTEKRDQSGESYLVVTAVQAGSPLDSAGVNVGDVLLAIDGVGVNEARDLREAFAGRPGRHQLLLKHNGALRQIVVDVR